MLTLQGTGLFSDGLSQFLAQTLVWQCCHRDPSGALPWSKELARLTMGTQKRAGDTSGWISLSLCCNLQFCHSPSTEFIHLCHRISTILCNELMVHFGIFLHRYSLKDLLCFRNILVLSSFIVLLQALTG